MRLILCVLLLTLTGCKSITSCFIIDLDEVALNPSSTRLTRSPEYQKEIDELLAKDAENKKWEKVFLNELRAAQKNDDYGAYEFFLEEYINTPRFILPEWIKKEPGWVPGVSIRDLGNDE